MDMSTNYENEYGRMQEVLKRQSAYLERYLGAEAHWFFVQGDKAIEHQLYVPGVVSLLHGIEMSLRMVVSEMKQTALDKTPTFSNRLLRQAQGLGIPVEDLALPSEHNFVDKLKTNKPDVDIVRLRHDMSHGNTLAFTGTVLGTKDPFFTPESLREVAEVLLEISGRWTESLSSFRSKHLRATPS